MRKLYVLFVISVIILFSGCVSIDKTYNMLFKYHVHKSIEIVIDHWGTPSQVFNRSNNKSIYEYSNKQIVSTTYGISTYYCNISFSVDENNLVYDIDMKYNQSFGDSCPWLIPKRFIRYAHDKKMR